MTGITRGIREPVSAVVFTGYLVFSTITSIAGSADATQSIQYTVHADNIVISTGPNFIASGWEPWTM